MKLNLKDWRNPDSLAKMTDGELFYVITNGRGKNDGWRGRSYKGNDALKSGEPGAVLPE